MVARPEARPHLELRDIQVPVRDRLEEVVQTMRSVVTTDLPMIEAVSGHLLQMRGKLFRPTLTLLASAVEGTPQPRAVTIGAVIELMHLATLVHDDSVDHSVLRRGLPTINALFSHQVSVIMGDFLYSRALTALVSVGDIEILRIITEVANQLTVGEMRQLAAVDRLQFTEADYYALIRAKTASLLTGACESGALCGAARHRQALAKYGDTLGMVFQIADDILDYTEDEATTGKPSGLDLREHKVTLPLIASLGRLADRSPGRRAIEALFATELPDDRQISDVIQIVAECGGIEYAHQCGVRFAEQAEACLQGLPDSAARRALAEAITYVLERRS